jgi:hypothetical protein
MSSIGHRMADGHDPSAMFSVGQAARFLTVGDNRIFSRGLWSGMRTNSVWRDSTFSSRLLTRPAERIQNTCSGSHGIDGVSAQKECNW